MKNLNVSVKGSICTVTFDLTKLQGPSKTGKTTVVATTEGNISIPGHEDVKLGVNAYTTAAPEAPALAAAAPKA